MIIFEPTFLSIDNKNVIYDIFYQNEIQKIIIIGPCIGEYNISLNGLPFKKIIDTSNHTNLWYLDYPEYLPIVDLIIEGNIYNLKVNNYPTFQSKLILSTNLKNESHYVKQWVEYWLKFGIDYVTIYDNNSSEEEFNNMVRILERFDNVFIFRWNYPYRYSPSGYSAQTCREAHAIWAHKNARFIGMFDVDEYIVPQTSQRGFDVGRFLMNILRKNKDGEIGAISIGGLCFGNIEDAPEHGKDFFKIINCEKEVNFSIKKMFIIPRNVDLMCVHQIVKGEQDLVLSSREILFNHYLFLNKKRDGDKGERGRNKSGFRSTNNKILNYVD